MAASRNSSAASSRVTELSAKLTLPTALFRPAFYFSFFRSTHAAIVIIRKKIHKNSLVTIQRRTTRQKDCEVNYSKFVFILKFYDVGIFLLKHVWIEAINQFSIHVLFEIFKYSILEYFYIYEIEEKCDLHRSKIMKIGTLFLEYQEFKRRYRIGVK